MPQAPSRALTAGSHTPVPSSVRRRRCCCSSSPPAAPATGYRPPANRSLSACQQVVIRLSTGYRPRNNMLFSAASSSHPSLPADSYSVSYTLLYNVGSPCIRARIPAPFPRQVVQSPAFTEVGWPIATCLPQCSSTFCLLRARESCCNGGARLWDPGGVLTFS